MKSERRNEWTFADYTPPEEENLKKFRSLGRFVICLMMMLALAVALSAPTDAEPARQDAEWSRTSALVESAPVELGEHSPIH